MSYCFLNGRFVSKERAFVSGYDLGFVRGYVIFDYLRTFNSRVFEMEEHVKRFFRSLEAAAIKIPHNRKEVEKIVQKGVSLNRFKETQIRLLASPGESRDSLFSSGRPTFAVLFDEFTPLPKSFYEKGVSVLTFSGDRVFPEIKHNIYFPALAVLKEARRKGFFEAVYKDRDGLLKEGITSNVFFFKKNRLVTPKAGVLKGVTRKIVIRLAKKFFTVEERDVKAAELKNFDESFITSTNKSVLPVIKIDRTVFGKKPGPNTKTLIRLFDDYVRKNCPA